MDTDLLLSPHSITPMYAQIMEQVIAKVMAGDWKAGDPLPSIRELAAGSQVSVITVKRAYLDLESEGVIVTGHGRGSFVAEAGNLAGDIENQKLDEHLDAAAGIAARLGLSSDELAARLRRAQGKLEPK